MDVRVEARPETDAAGREAAAHAIVRAVRENVGIGVDATVVDPDTLERSLGKLRPVEDLRHS